MRFSSLQERRKDQHRANRRSIEHRGEYTDSLYEFRYHFHQFNLNHNHNRIAMSHYRRSRSIRSERELNLRGPLDIAGSVKSGSSISFNGDFIVREKVDAYGAIDMNGSIRCE